MRDRLKIFFGLLRPFKESKLTTYLDLSYDDIEQWDEKFYFETSRKEIELPSIITSTLEKIIEEMMPKFHRDNNYDLDDYWTLNVRIFPNESRINFQSECKFSNTSPYEYDIDLTSSEKISRTGDKKTLPPNLVNNIDLVFDNEMPEEVESVGFTFDAKWGEIYLNDFEIDGYRDQTRLGPWNTLLDKIMTFLVDRFWDEEVGMEGEITIEKGKSIKIDCEFRSEEYELTDMNINITPDSF
jgi:hypothetical protein